MPKAYGAAYLKCIPSPLQRSAQALAFSNNGRYNNQNGGFTLIELMVVLLLISIVLAVAIPRFDSGIGQDPRKKLSRWIINTVRTLRSKALQEQKVQTLVIDLDSRRMWTINAAMEEETLANAAKKAFKIPKSIYIIDIQMPQQERITSGTVEINFHPAGYSDHTLIHLEDNDAQRFSYMLAPLLPKVKVYEEWMDFTE